MAPNRILLRAIEAGIVIEGCIDFPGCDHEPSSVGCGHSGSLRGGGWPAFQREGRQDPGRVCSGLSLPDRVTSLAGRITGHRVLGQAGALHQTSRSPGKKHWATPRLAQLDLAKEMASLFVFLSGLKQNVRFDACFSTNLWCSFTW